MAEKLEFKARQEELKKLIGLHGYDKISKLANLTVRTLTVFVGSTKQTISTDRLDLVKYRLEDTVR